MEKHSTCGSLKSFSLNGQNFSVSTWLKSFITTDYDIVLIAREIFFVEMFHLWQHNSITLHAFYRKLTCRQYVSFNWNEKSRIFFVWNVRGTRCIIGGSIACISRGRDNEQQTTLHLFLNYPSDCHDSLILAAHFASETNVEGLNNH